MPANQVATEKDVKGHEIDEELANGPTTKRVCRDVLCCLLFLVFVGGFVGVAIYGYVAGNPSLIGRGYDSDGNMCGVTTGYEGYPYLYLPDPTTLTDGLCLSSCPTTYSAGSSATVSCKTTTVHTSCTLSYGVYKTSTYASRYCLPTDVVTVASGSTQTIIDSFASLDVLEQWVSDIRETWPVIAISIAVAFVIGFVYMIFLRYCSGILTWLAILAFIAGLSILGWRFYDTATTLESSDTGNSTSQTVTTEKVIAYICWGVAGFTFLAVLCLFNRIRLAIAILKAAADYVKDTPSVFLVPPVMVVLLLGFYAFWTGAAVFLVSSGTPIQYDNTAFGYFSFDTNLKRLLIYHLFGLLWINAFILASAQFIQASSTAIWYFSQGTGQSTPNTVKTSVKRLFRYHFGSIAFGSLILAIIQFIRIVLAYIEAQTKKMQGKENKLVKYTLKCLQCYAACFERFIKFLNKNAYIQIALTGKSFCGAAKDAFLLILHNPLRMGVVTSIGSIFVLFGKIFIAAITALIAFLVLTKWDRYSDEISSPFIPTLLVLVFAYMVGAVFMTVYGLAADTILACFIVDEELSKKQKAAPRHCPATLKDFLDKHGEKKADKK